MTQKKILVTDAQLKIALSVIRSLGRKNMKVTALSEKNTALCFYSKYCSDKLISPNPRTDPQLFIKFLLNVVKNNDYDCIIPNHTYTTFLLSKYQDIFSDYIQVPPPNFDVFFNAYDKTKLLKFAMSNGIDCPETYFGENLDEIVSIVQKYPVVVKSSRRHGVGIAICKNESELRDKYIEMSSKYGQCIVQDFIPNGGEFGVYTLFNLDSEPIALTVQKRNHTIYQYGGVSSLRQTVRNDSIVKIAFNLLKKLKWAGVAMVEFRTDERDGIPKLMEINPRFWGSLELSIQSGVDFPYLLHQLMMNGNPPIELDFKENVKCRWLFGEFTRVFWCPNKLGVIQDIIRPGLSCDIFSFKDLGPMVVSTFFPPRDSCDEEQREEDPTIYGNELIEK